MTEKSFFFLENSNYSLLYAFDGVAGSDTNCHPRMGAPSVRRVC